MNEFYVMYINEQGSYNHLIPDAIDLYVFLADYISGLEGVSGQSCINKVIFRGFLVLFIYSFCNIVLWTFSF